MEAKNLSLVSDGANVLEQLSASLQHVVSQKGSSGLDGAVLGTGDFARMRPAIEEAWRQQLEREDNTRQSATLPPVQPSVAQAYGGDDLLNDLQKLFDDSWRHPEADLRPEIARICESWKRKQMEAKNLSLVSDGANVLEQLSASLQHVVSQKGSSGLDGAVLGTGDFARMRPAIEEAWRQQLEREDNTRPSATLPPVQPSVAQAYGGDFLFNDVLNLFNAGWEYHLDSESKIELAQVCETWKARQLEAQGLSAGSDVAVVLQKLSQSLQGVVQRHGLLDAKGFAELRPEIEDVWQRQLRSASVSRPRSLEPSGFAVEEVYGGADLLDALERLLADGPGASNLRPELSSLCEQWQSRQREALSAGVEQLAKSAVSAISAPATSDFGLFRAEIERLWSRELQVQTVQAYGGDALLQDMERLFSDGTWTEAEVAKACDTWKARQQDAHRVTLKKLANSVEVVVDKNLSDLGESDQLDFKRLRPQIEEAWRSAERGGRQDKVNSKLEKRAKAQVLKDGDGLLQDLQGMFDVAWSRCYGEDLRPEFESRCSKWAHRTLQERGLGEDSELARTLQGFVDAARQVLVTQGAGMPADMAFHEKMQSEIKDLWKRQVHGEQPRSRPGVKLDRHSRSQAVADGEQLLRELEDLFKGSWARPGANLLSDVSQSCADWKARQLAARGVGEDSELGAWLQKLLDSLQGVLQPEGEASGSDFIRLRPQIQGAWRQHLAEANGQDSSTSPEKARHREDRNRSRSRPRSSPDLAKADRAREELLQKLEGILQNTDSDERKMLEVQRLLQHWQRYQASENVDTITAELLRSLADAAESAAKSSLKEVVPAIQDTWQRCSAQLSKVAAPPSSISGKAWHSWCPNDRAEVGRRGEELLSNIKRLLKTKGDFNEELDLLLDSWQNADGEPSMVLQDMADAARNVSVWLVNSGNCDYSLVEERVHAAWRATLEQASTSTRPAKSRASSRRRRLMDSDAEDRHSEVSSHPPDEKPTQRSRSRPGQRTDGRSERPGGKARSTSRHAKQPSADMDILDRLEVDALRPSRSMEGKQFTPYSGDALSRGPSLGASSHHELDAVSRDHSIGSHGYSGDLETRRSCSPQRPVDVKKYRKRAPLSMAGAITVKETRDR